MKTIITHSLEETEKLASNLAKELDKGVIIALVGELGAGKTTFVQSFAKKLGITDKIISPTFVLTRQHLIPQSNGVFYHLDLYRLESIAEIKKLGIEEMAQDNNVVMIEWAQKARKLLPKNTTWIYIETQDDRTRKFTIYSAPA